MEKPRTSKDNYSMKMGTYFYTVNAEPTKGEKYFSTIAPTGLRLVEATDLKESLQSYQSTPKVNEKNEMEKYITGNVIWGNKLDSTVNEAIFTTKKISKNEKRYSTKKN